MFFTRREVNTWEKEVNVSEGRKRKRRDRESARRWSNLSWDQLSSVNIAISVSHWWRNALSGRKSFFFYKYSFISPFLQQSTIVRFSGNHWEKLRSMSLRFTSLSQYNIEPLWRLKITEASAGQLIEQAIDTHSFPVWALKSWINAKLAYSD